MVERARINVEFNDSTLYTWMVFILNSSSFNRWALGPGPLYKSSTSLIQGFSRLKSKEDPCTIIKKYNTMKNYI